MSKFAVMGSILLLSVLSYGQDWRGVPGYCPYGCGPYVPLITTPSLALTTFSPNPVGATQRHRRADCGRNQFDALRDLRQHGRSLHSAGVVFGRADSDHFSHHSRTGSSWTRAGNAGIRS